MEKIMMYLIDVEHSSHGEILINPELKQYYRVLNCELIEIATRKIGNNYYDNICDEEGLFRDNRIVSAADREGKPMFVGNLLICKDDGEGNEIGLTADEIREIKDNMARAAHFSETRGIETTPILICDY